MKIDMEKDTRGVSASFRCDLCGKEASHVILVPSGQPDPRLCPETADVPKGISTIMSDRPQLSINGGPVTFTIGVSEEDFERVRDALLAQSAAQLYDINHEYAPFWCPNCRCCYCKTHFKSYAAFDDGFFDCYYGTCPKGHKRMLVD